MNISSTKKLIPFAFVLDALHPLALEIKPMFGCYAIYVRDKIVLILRNKNKDSNDNGVWIATTHEHHQSLKKDLPSLRSIALFGGAESGWQNLPVDGDYFEDEVLKACSFILKGDFRIGKLSKSRGKKITNLGH